MKNCKILVIDDESRMRKLVRDFLTKKNYEVLEASNGEEAMEIFYEDKEIDMKDVVLLAQYVAEWDSALESVDPSTTDVNADGETDMKDVVLLAQYVDITNELICHALSFALLSLYFGST